MGHASLSRQSERHVPGISATEGLEVAQTRSGGQRSAPTAVPIRHTILLRFEREYILCLTNLAWLDTSVRRGIRIFGAMPLRRENTHTDTVSPSGRDRSCHWIVDTLLSSSGHCRPANHCTAAALRSVSIPLHHNAHRLCILCHRCIVLMARIHLFPSETSVGEASILHLGHAVWRTFWGSRRQVGAEPSTLQ